MNIAALGDVVEAIRGVTFPAADLSTDPSAGRIACLTTSAVHEPLRWSTARFIPSTFLRSPNQMLRPGDILMSTANSKPNVGISAYVGVVPMEATFGAFVTVIRAGPDVDSRYLSFWFRSSRFMDVANSLASQTTNIANLRVSDLLATNLPLPSLDKQREIAASMADKLATIKAASAASASRSEATLSLRGNSYKAAFRAEMPFSLDSPSGKSPPGWAWHLLTDLARLETGHTPSRDRQDWWSGQIPWLALPDIRRVDGRVAIDTLESTNPAGIAHSAARVLPADTVVMSRTASVGFVARMGRPMATSQDFVNWVCGPGLDPEFLMHLLIRSRSEIRSLASGAIHKTVYFPTVKSFRVCIPAITEQRRIASELRERLASIDGMESAIRAEQEAIDALPAALLRRAFENHAA